MLRSIFSRKWFFVRTEVDRILTLSMLFSVILVIVGMIYTTYFVYLFLIWNLFLAYIPYFISSWLRRKPDAIESKLKFGLLFLSWLAFIPNSFYILTDIFHLGQTHWVPLWFDLIVLVSFAFNGALLGFVSIRQMEQVIEIKLRKNLEWFFTFPLLLLNGLGVYIGRYLRYNSWDFITNPLQLSSDILSLIIHPFSHVYAWAMIVCFSILLGLVYLVVKRLGNLIG